MRKQHDKNEQPEKPKKTGKQKAYSQGESSEKDKTGMGGDQGNPVA